MDAERYDVVVIGGGQAGLATGYYLQRAGRRFVILDAHDRVGQEWRRRWDSLRLFTPARYCGLPGLRFPLQGSRCPTKDQMADYLETYAAHLRLPVRTGVHVDRVTSEGGRFVIGAGDLRIEAEAVVVATGAHRDPRIPVFARDLDPSIVQLHSSEYRNPSQLRDGGVLIVGAGNSGADICLEVVRTHPTWLAGPELAHVPADIDTWIARHIVFRIVRFVMLHVLTLRNPIGRKARRSSSMKGDMLVRVKPKWIRAAGVERVPRAVAAADGIPVLEDGRALDARSVIWCTGFRHDLSWIDLPIFGEDGEPQHERGVAATVPGLYFMGLPFQFAAGSDAIPGVARDARYLVKRLIAHDRDASRIPVAA
jgi:putative flavoprotein involved in K+ transport